MIKVDKIQDLINNYIEDQPFAGEPTELYEPIEYILRQGGKRMRPTLCLLACDLFGGNIYDCMVPAVAAEIFHNFTLVHDDIMDQAPLRRGMETVYHKWNSDIALLSGDTMLIKAFQYVLSTKKEYSHEVLAELCKVGLTVRQIKFVLYGQFFMQKPIEFMPPDHKYFQESNFLLILRI